MTGRSLHGFDVGLEIQASGPETNERFIIQAAMVPHHYLLNIANFFPNLPPPSWPPVESHEIDFAVLRLGFRRIYRWRPRGAKMRCAVVIGNRMQDAAGRDVVVHCEGS